MLEFSKSLLNVLLELFELDVTLLKYVDVF